MKIKTSKARLIAKSIVCIVLAMAILIPATMFSLAENETAVLTTPKEMSSDTLEYYDLEKGVYTSKKVTGPNADGTYNVTVDTYTSDVKYISGSAEPIDMMILLDNSASMNIDNRGSDAKKAAADILDKMVNIYGAGSRIEINVCMYTFGNSCTDSTSYRFGYRSLNKGSLNDIQDKITKILGNGISGTNTGEAFERMNEKISARKSENPNHKQILLFLSDGAPALVTSFDAVGKGYANKAIAAANELKNNGVDIFCIGMRDDFIEAKSNDPQSNFLKDVTENGKNSFAQRTTLFTAIISSGYTTQSTQEFNWNNSVFDNSLSWEKVWTCYTKSSNTGTKYYQGNAEGYEAISKAINNVVLDSISTHIVTQGSLLGDYSVKDTVSSYFEIVPNSAEFYRVAYQGMNEKDFSVDDIENPNKLYGATAREFNETGKTPLALDYTETSSTIEVLATEKNISLVDAIVIDDLVDSTNEKHEGNKLRITYKIRPKDSFMGGSSVPTHDYTNSGIYKGKEVIQSFDKANSSETNPVPTMSVELVRPTKITANSNAKIGFLYPTENVGNTNVSVMYQGRYADENGTFNSYTMNSDSGIVYDKNGNEITYGSYEVESDTDNDKTKGTATSGSETESTGTKTTYFILPSDYACLMYGKASKTDDSVGVVENSGYIQFNSTGISLNGKTYSSEDIEIEKTYYLAWNSYDANEIVQRFEKYVENTHRDNEATPDKGIAQYTDANGDVVGNPILFRNGFRSVEQFTGTVGINVHVPTVTVNDAVYTTAVSAGYKYSSNELAAAINAYHAGAQTEDAQAIIDYITTGDLKNFVPTTINTTEFKLPIIKDGKIVYKLTASDEFIAPIEEFDKDVYVVSYVKGYDKKDNTTNTDIADGDQLQIVLEYVNAEGQRIVNTATKNLLDFQYTFDAFEAINQCSYCANSYTPQFLGYSAQVHKEAAAQRRFITVRKDGAHDDTDSFIFGVYGYNKAADGSVDVKSRKLLGTFVIHGNNTQTVSVSKANYDYFSVEENLSEKFDKGWSWNYNDVDVSFDGSAQSNTATDKGFPIFSFTDNSDGANVMLTFKNTYDTSTEKIASDSTWCINIIKSNSITRMTEDGTETFAKKITENTETTTVAE